MELSIIVTSYKIPHLLSLCLEAIQNNVTIKYEIIVADSATEEATRDLIKENFPQVKFLANKKNVGFLRLVNQSLDIAKGKYFFIINGDIILQKDSVEKMLDFLKKHPEVGMLGPQLINFDGSVQPSCFRFYRPITIFYRRAKFFKKNPWVKKELDWFLMKDKIKTKENYWEADWIMGSAMLVTRQAVEKVGKMDERFFMYMEDVDWCWRFWQQGFKVIYYPLAKVFHYHGKKSAGKSFFYDLLFNKYTHIHIISGIKFFLKHWKEKSPHQS